jgi:PAS domain S-box-containing protein
VVESLFGYEPGELDGAELQRLVQPEAGPMLEQMIERVLESAEPVGSEVNALRRDGTSFSAQFVLSPLKHEGTITAIVCTIRDITEWVRLRQMKDAFVSNVSHELRTPITSLRLNYGLMKRDPAQSDKYLNRFDREITRLDELIEDLLRLSRLDQGKVDLKSEPIQLNEMAAATVADRTPIAESNELKLTFHHSSQAPLVIADAGLLNQVLNVLLTNAINYTPPGGHIEVRIEHELTDGGAWAGFSIKDDGVGIDREERALLFERFYRGKAGRDSGAPGTGLGLAIAEEIVRRHHGRIEVDSKGIPGEGSTFTVWLAAAEEDNLPSK